MSKHSTMPAYVQSALNLTGTLQFHVDAFVQGEPNEVNGLLHSACDVGHDFFRGRRKSTRREERRIRAARITRDTGYLSTLPLTTVYTICS